MRCCESASLSPTEYRAMGIVPNRGMVVAVQVMPYQLYEFDRL